jgi:hypothetical protein
MQQARRGDSAPDRPGYPTHRAHFKEKAMKSHPTHHFMVLALVLTALAVWAALPKSLLLSFQRGNVDALSRPSGDWTQTR